MPVKIEYPLNSVVEKNLCVRCRRSMAWETCYLPDGSQRAAAQCCGHTYIFADHDFQSRQQHYWSLQNQNHARSRNRGRKALGWSLIIGSVIAAGASALYAFSQ